MASVTVRESEFSHDDVAALLASRRHAAVVRGPHGIPVLEARDPANQFAFEAKPVRDHAFAALSAAQDAYFRDYPSAKKDQSIGWVVTRREGS